MENVAGRRAVAAGVLGLAGLATVRPAAAFVGSRPECLAPSAPGGGWDFTCRTVGRLLQELRVVDQPVQVSNMPGAVGAVAFANVTSRRAADNNLFVATSTVGLTQIAQRRYPGDIDRVRWLAMLGADTGVILVRADSRFKTLGDFLNALKESPDGVVTGGSSSLGGYDHLRMLLLAQKAGIPSADLKRFRWIHYDGGGPAVTQMLGGHVEVVSTDLAEIAGFVEAGQIRVLGAMAEARLPGAFANIPTAREQGYDVVGLNWRGFYTGGRVSDDNYNAMLAGLKRVYDSDGWKEAARRSGLQPIWRGGQEFERFVASMVADLRSLSQEIGIIS
ncbi:hypothetical protein HMPREF9946_00377 [Acetobacteraceae bacterium AT-5844]|nr:hypothetical protein HMPREF9946_00377 [Acetobacteraceae bacterium AT-5844]